MTDNWFHALLVGDADALRSSFPLAEAMAASAQDPVFHAEGDVWTHTCRVIDLARRDETARGRISGLAGVTTVMAGLLHDVAKPATMIREFDPDLGRERVRNPGHAARGATMAWRLTAEIPMGLELRYRVSQIVAWHHRPGHLHALDPDEARLRVLRFAATGISWRDLTDFCRHDNMGRDCPDHEEGMIALGLSDMEAGAIGEGLGVDILDRGADWSPEFRARIGRPSPDIHLGSQPPYRGRLLITVGLPGSGKSSWVARRRETTGACVVSADAIRGEMREWRRDKASEGRVFQEFDRRLRAAMAAGGEVIADGTFLTASLREKFVSMGHAYDMRVGVVLMDVPESLARARNRAREARVPDDVMDRYAQAFSLPQPYGVHDLITVDRHGDEFPLAGDVAPEALQSPEP